MSNNNCKFCGVDVTLFRWCRNQACRLYNRRVPAVRGPAFGSELCIRCNGLLSFTNPCPECLRNEPEAIFKRFDEPDKEALKAELGVSSEVELRTFNEDAALTFGKEWKGYNLEFLGVELGRYLEWPIPPEGREFYAQIGAIALRNDGGYDIIRPALLLPFTCIHLAENPDLVIKLCRIRAFYKRSPLYSEMRPHAFGVRRVAIHGLEHKHTQNEPDKAFKGLDLLRAARKKLGRPEGTRYYSERDFLPAAARAYRRLFNSSGEHPKDENIAHELAISTSAFYDTMSDYGLHLSDIRAAALKD
jgi:hypothetical protein